ncbi:MAG: DNA alkylation repair protein, partial [Halobacteriovoraceae bacterium]|nr:DNA alkylation repair protein [Halobacteriovoraceae bacterium]
VDCSSPYIVGAYLLNRDRKILYTWAMSDHLWTKRIAMLANWWFIRKGDLAEVFKMAKILLNDEHDLMHKAVGWMLREAGKKDLKKLEDFLKKHYQDMPRTMLRYSIEKFPEQKRQRYLKGKI